MKIVRKSLSIILSLLGVATLTTSEVTAKQHVTLDNNSDESEMQVEDIVDTIDAFDRAPC